MIQYYPTYPVCVPKLIGYWISNPDVTWILKGIGNLMLFRLLQELVYGNALLSDDAGEGR
jgi:hypothetical protein